MALFGIELQRRPFRVPPPTLPSPPASPRFPSNDRSPSDTDDDPLHPGHYAPPPARRAGRAAGGGRGDPGDVGPVLAGGIGPRRVAAARVRHRRPGRRPIRAGPA